MEPMLRGFLISNNTYDFDSVGGVGSGGGHGESWTQHTYQSGQGGTSNRWGALLWQAGASQEVDELAPG